eukprot:s140_g49.t1
MTELCQKWKSTQLQQLTQVEATETSPWIQTLLDQVEKVLHQEAGTADGRLLGNADFARSQQQIVESWEKDNPTAWLRDVKTSKNCAKSSQAARSSERGKAINPWTQPITSTGAEKATSDAKQRSSASVHSMLRVKKRQALPQAGSILMKESRDEARP